MTLYGVLDDLSGAGLAPTVLGEVALAESNSTPRATLRRGQLFDDSEAFLRAAGSRWNLAANLSIRVATTAMSGDHAQSIALPRKNLALALGLRDTQTTAYNSKGLAGV